MNNIDLQFMSNGVNEKASEVLSEYMDNKKIPVENIDRLNQVLKLVIKTHISKESQNKLKNDIEKVTQYISQEEKFILIKLFLQIGRPDHETNFKSLDYQNMTDITVSLQPKIKNYVTFKTSEGLKNYMINHLNQGDLLLCYSYQDGKLHSITTD